MWTLVSMLHWPAENGFMEWLLIKYQQTLMPTFLEVVLRIYSRSESRFIHVLTFGHGA